MLKAKRRTRNSLSRKEILDVSLDIIQKEGIQSLNMRSIAKNLKCSVASPYNHFRSQEEIIQALIQEGEEKLAQDLMLAKLNNQTVYTQLREIAHTYRNFATANIELHKLMFTTLNKRKGNTSKKIITTVPKSYRIFLDTLRSGFKNGSIPLPRKEFHGIVRTMWSWIYGLIILELTGLLNSKDNSENPIEEGISVFSQALKIEKK
ncbi:MAG: TetR/AcrR family transcriptional regulator [Leptospiraceae bacterium]|nr:TetR/AcrR family transcriptional regulator [Leptospiraceae bacterium]NUM40637.1 TetR/AcrR family transcriptional regulator [Leptospiraceae bacterium]